MSKLTAKMNIQVPQELPRNPNWKHRLWVLISDEVKFSFIPMYNMLGIKGVMDTSYDRSSNFCRAQNWSVKVDIFILSHVGLQFISNFAPYHLFDWDVLEKAFWISLIWGNWRLQFFSLFDVQPCRSTIHFDKWLGFVSDSTRPILCVISKFFVLFFR